MRKVPSFVTFVRCRPAGIYTMKKLLLLTGLLLAGYISFADSLDIKIGQMIMIGIGDRKSLSPDDPLREELRSGKIGGIVLFEKNIDAAAPAERLTALTGDCRALATIPVWVSIDEEGGKVHRLKEKYGFVAMPSAAAMGQADNTDSTAWYYGRLARELKLLGFNLNYAPDVDVAVNPDNSVIVQKGRSFSAVPATVSRHALACITAHKAIGVGTILKHFPGHGSSAGDSHLGIVDVSDTWKFRELLPFAEVIESGECRAVMTAHIINKHWDATMLPATLSKKVIQDMLRGFLGFRGVVFSDDMQMGAINKNYGLAEAIVLAVNAGVDVLMFANNVQPDQQPVTASEIHHLIRKLVKQRKIKPRQIDEAYRRIMALKTGLSA